MVLNGGTEKATSHSWGLIAQRYAYDLVSCGPENRRFQTDGKELTDYFAFDRNVIAAADGVVVEVEDEIRDIQTTGSGWIDVWTRDIRGNFVVIEHGENVFSLTAHLKKHSCIVKKGDKVRRGQVIAKCGNSGHSTEPHVHFQIQDRANFYFARGLPIPFGGIVIKNDGAQNVSNETRVHITKNNVVSNAAPNQGAFWEVKVDYPMSDDWPIHLLRSVLTLLTLISAYAFIIVTIATRLFTIGLAFIVK